MPLEFPQLYLGHKGVEGGQEAVKKTLDAVLESAF
jgi:hypothetical protein